MASLPTFQGYSPINGNIPDHLTRIETIGEACHDFQIKRSRPKVVNLRKELIQKLRVEKYTKTEHQISELLHAEFNGSGLVKVDLRLSEPAKVYTSPEALSIDLFEGTADVKPLVFTISS